MSRALRLGGPSAIIALIALANLLRHLATSPGYVYFRDEFYDLACADHLAPGYVDHPPLSIFFLWSVHHALGDSPFAVRLLPAVLGAATVALVGLMARALGEWPSTEERKELGELDQFYADMHGWDAIVGTVAEVCRRLPPEDAAAARLFGPDYGVAGAVDPLGRRQGLSPAISGHNNYWLWGPRGWDGRVLIEVGGSEERLRALFDAVERAATVDCGRCMPYENRRPVWVCRGLREPVAQVWARIKHYD